LIITLLADDLGCGGISGSYGSIPIPVSRACQALADEIEGNPDKFIRLNYKARWVHCRERIAALIGADVDECVVVPNTTEGINIVLRNIDWKKGDVIIKSVVLITFPRAAAKAFFSEHNLRRHR
jgi:kynureninase